MNNYFAETSNSVPRPVKLEQGSVASLWSKNDPVMDEKTLVKGGMWNHQRVWWDMPNFIKALVAGYGAGKTNIAGKRLIALALQNAPCPVASVSPTFVIARRTMIPTLKELLAGKQTHYGKRAFWWKYNASHHEFHIKFRGRAGIIPIYSGEDPDALKGPNLAAAIIDEPFIQAYGVFKQIITRIRHPNAVQLELGLTGTPEQLNWGYDLCAGEDKSKYDVGVVYASSRANLAVAATGYIQRLEGTYAGKEADAYIEGQFANLSTGQVFYAFDPREQVGNVMVLPVPESAEWGAGMDFNVNPMTASIFWKAGSHMHFVGEIELPNADTEYMCDYIRDHFPHVKNIYPDASGNARKSSAPQGKTDFWYIRQAGYNILANHENPKLKDSYNAVNGKFKPKVGPITLTIDPKCRKLIKYLSVHTHELMNTKEQKPMRHLIDAFRYPVTYLFPIVRETATITKLTGS
jgi:terminase large subunit-like protein